jgi:transcriptional regulator with GAF, ATPase, and Fis domain
VRASEPDGRPPDDEILPLQAVERRTIEGCLERCRWVIEGPHGAAASLGLQPSTLRSRMKKLGILRPTGV